MKEKNSTTNWTIINESLLRRIGNIEIGLHIANSRHGGHVDTLANSRICYSQTARQKCFFFLIRNPLLNVLDFFRLKLLINHTGKNKYHSLKEVKFNKCI